MSKERKVHYFPGCSFTPWQRQEPQVTQYLSSVTCGQCKGRVLEHIRALDWAQLTPEQLGVLYDFAAKLDR